MMSIGLMATQAISEKVHAIRAVSRLSEMWS